MRAAGICCSSSDEEASAQRVITRGFGCTTSSSLELLLSMCLHAADVSNPLKPWSNRVCSVRLASSLLNRPSLPCLLKNMRSIAFVSACLISSVHGNAAQVEDMKPIAKLLLASNQEAAFTLASPATRSATCGRRDP